MNQRNAGPTTNRLYLLYHYKAVARESVSLRRGNAVKALVAGSAKRRQNIQTTITRAEAVNRQSAGPTINRLYLLYH